MPVLLSKTLLFSKRDCFRLLSNSRNTRKKNGMMLLALWIEIKVAVQNIKICGCKERFIPFIYRYYDKYYQPQEIYDINIIIYLSFYLYIHVPNSNMFYICMKAGFNQRNIHYILVNNILNRNWTRLPTFI